MFLATEGVFCCVSSPSRFDSRALISMKFWAQLTRNVAFSVGTTERTNEGVGIGRLRNMVDSCKIDGLRDQGIGRKKKISREMRIGVGTLYRFVGEGSKTRGMVI